MNIILDMSFYFTQFIEVLRLNNCGIDKSGYTRVINYSNTNCNLIIGVASF